MHAEQALHMLLIDDPKLTIPIVRQGSCVTMDYRTDRVRLFVDSQNTVV